MPTPHLVIIGAGYAGVMAALRARRRASGARVTLVNASVHFVERIRLHELSAGHARAPIAIAALVADRGIDVTIGRADAVDLSRRTVSVRADERSTELAYDALVLALGSATDRDAVPGARAHAAFFDSPAEARAIADRLRPGADVVVVGGGLTGIELASEIAEAHPEVHVTLVARTLGESLSPAARAYVRTVMATLHATIIEGEGVAAVETDVVVLANGTRLPSTVCIWAAGFRPPALAREAGLAVDPHGRAWVDAARRSTSHPEVFIAGDAAIAVDGSGARMACQTAMPAGAQAGENAARALGAEPLVPLPFAYSGQGVSLGRKHAVVQVVRSDDAPTPRIITGLVAVMLKEGVCRYTVAALRLERRFPGSFHWPTWSPLAAVPTLRLTSGT